MFLPNHWLFKIYMTGLTFNNPVITSVTQLESFFSFVPESQIMHSTSMNSASKACITLSTMNSSLDVLYTTN